LTTLIAAVLLVYTPTLEQHTHHETGSARSECIACHMPAIEQWCGATRSASSRPARPND
jgi:hypothetical protein